MNIIEGETIDIRKEIIEKACEWLDNIDTDDYMVSGIFQMSDLIMDFKKAIEEQL